ncbi:MAG: 16S rRNA (guanine(966)-N(2))-methyltransferase RsmD [Geobacteraceae bacterium]|nr:16S rRNA (guanine(966)-N(2))-methyltransferase RsmD [Geobacteraceae bacterium]
MRVIAGTAKGRKLHPPTGSRVRPTADRVKEALFSSLTSRFGSFDGVNVLDLFSGSGGLGIEALSRGAKKVVFVDAHPESIALTQKNLALTGFTDQATVLKSDALKAIRQLSDNGTVFDLILIDPPYADKEVTTEALTLIVKSSLLSSSGVMAVETDNRFELPLPDTLSLANKRVYGDTATWLLECA